MDHPSRQELTSRQALSRALKETATATHLVVKFTEGEELSVVPMKRVTHPTPSELNESSMCSVRWSDKMIYNANVKGVLGKKALSPNRIERIKQIVFNHFTLETGEKYEWSNCRRAIDENSRKLKQVENQPTKKK